MILHGNCARFVTADFFDLNCDVVALPCFRSSFLLVIFFEELSFDFFSILAPSPTHSHDSLREVFEDPTQSYSEKGVFFSPAFEPTGLVHAKSHVLNSVHSCQD